MRLPAHENAVNVDARCGASPSALASLISAAQSHDSSFVKHFRCLDRERGVELCWSEVCLAIVLSLMSPNVLIFIFFFFLTLSVCIGCLRFTDQYGCSLSFFFLFALFSLAHFRLCFTLRAAISSTRARGRQSWPELNDCLR